MALNILAWAWGACEAVFFFIVPDVLLTAIALKSPKHAGIALIWCVAGSLLGGAYLFSRTADDIGQSFENLYSVPAISQPLVADASADVAEEGVWSMMMGPFRGVPYKIYVVHLSVARVEWAPFLSVTLLARTIRFSLLVGVAMLCGWLMKSQTYKARLCVHLMLWCVFYTFYFWKMTS